VAGLLGGLALPLIGASLAGGKKRRGQAIKAEKKRKKKCQDGLLTCTIKQGKKKKKLCVDAQTDPGNCGACSNACVNGQVCQSGTCTCNGTICAGCCDGNTCQAGTSNQQCGTNGAACQVCSAVQNCGGGGTPGVCGCTKTTCAAEGKNCGTIPDGCGGELNCGTCDGGQSGNETCGGSGVPNICGCLADGVQFLYEDSCDPCCSGDCCFVSEGIRVCAGGCG
jgi:hypothetical protein